LLLFDLQRLSRKPLDLPKLIAFVAAAERGGNACCAGASGPADAMYVNLRYLGQLIVDDV
jgi:hypothetical protein